MAKVNLKDLTTRTQQLFDDEDNTMDTICAHVSSGGSLIDLCDTWSVRFGDMTNWIRKNKSRNDRYVDAQNDRNEWSRERILVELRRIGLADIRKLYDDHGSLKEPKDWPEEISSIISGFDAAKNSDGDTILKVKFWNKEKALEMLGKNISMFIDRVEHSGKLTLEDLIQASRDEDEQ